MRPTPVRRLWLVKKFTALLIYGSAPVTGMFSTIIEIIQPDRSRSLLLFGVLADGCWQPKSSSARLSGFRQLSTADPREHAGIWHWIVAVDSPGENEP